MSGLTGTTSEAAAYEFTTLTTVPGTLDIHGAKLQILDLPGIIEGAKDGKGRGRQVIAVARTCNLIFMVLDVCKPLADKAKLEKELEGVGIRLNKTPPNIVVRKKDKGGVTVTNTVPLNNIDNDVVRAVCNEYKISNADVAFRCDATVEDLIDVIEGNRIYIPCIYVLNKIDAISIEELDLLYKIPMSVPISSKMWLNIDELTEKMWEELRLVRVYTKPHKAPPDYSQPVVLRQGRSSVLDFANAIHKDIAKQFKIAMVYGASAKHPRGQRVGLDHVLMDEGEFFMHLSHRHMLTILSLHLSRRRHSLQALKPVSLVAKYTSAAFSHLQSPVCSLLRSACFFESTLLECALPECISLPSLSIR